MSSHWGNINADVSSHWVNSQNIHPGARYMCKRENSITIIKRENTYKSVPYNAWHIVGAGMWVKIQTPHFFYLRITIFKYLFTISFKKTLKSIIYSVGCQQIFPRGLQDLMYFWKTLICSDWLELLQPFFLYPQKTTQGALMWWWFFQGAWHWFLDFPCYLFIPPNKPMRQILLSVPFNRWGMES